MYRLPARLVAIFGASSNLWQMSTSCEEGKLKKEKIAKVVWNNDWDGTADAKKGKAMRQYVFIRHGQYEQAGAGDPDIDQVLTPLGRDQAARTGVRLKELIDSKVIYPIDKVYYSTMSRATETFNQIVPSLPPLAEHQMKSCSMIREGAVCRPIPETANWRVSEIDFLRDGKRVDAAFVNYIHRAEPEEDADNSTIMVCHGNVIRYFVMRALQLPPEAWLRTACWNASITVVEVYPSGKCSLRCFGDVGHLPAEMITYN